MMNKLAAERAEALSSAPHRRSPSDKPTELARGTEELVASVVICTYNRPLLLEAAVRSCLANATRQGLKFEIVIADNSVDDHAVPLVELLQGAAIPIRRVAASPPNISIARNAGVRAAQAPLVAFLDDDAEVDAGWLDALVETLQRTSADAAVGPVRAVFIGEPPKWDRDGSRFSRMLPYHSGASIVVVGPRRPRDFAIGTGNSIWRSQTCFTDAEPFDPWFGAAGGEDLDLFMRLARRGRHIVWCAEAGVSEIVPTSRTSFSNQFLRVFSSAQGYAAASIKNSETKWPTALSIMLRGSAQVLAYGLAVVPLGVVALARSAAADEALKKTVLKLSAGLGKALWWRRLSYYHMEKPQQA